MLLQRILCYTHKNHETGLMIGKDEISIMKRVALSALIVLGIFLLLFLLLIGGFKYRTEYAKTEVETYYSDDHDYKLAIYQIGEPQFPFGPGKCRFVLTKDDKKINGIDILLLNDGKWPHPKNFSVSWASDHVAIVASGEEQEDITYILYYDGRKDSKQSQ